MPDLKMLNSTKYLYKLTFIKCSYKFLETVWRFVALVTATGTTENNLILCLLISACGIDFCAKPTFFVTK